MTSNALDHIGTSTATRHPDRVGQATAIEQSRAVAEVQAAIVVAQQVPRDIQAALAQMRDSCRQPALAERAFFRYSRGGNQITGPGVHLARELARCWGNVQYGISELRRDDEHHQSEMQAYAWDVQTNARAATTFIVPHKRDTRDGPRTLTDMRDVYENNANNGARRVREMIFSVLPPWFVEEAKDICNATLADGGGKPLAQRIDEAVAAYARSGIKREQLEQRVDKAVAKWDEHDVAQLGVIYTSLTRGEVTRGEEFPAPRVTGEEITGYKKADPEFDTTAGDVQTNESPLLDTSGRLAKRMFAMFGEAGITDQTERLAYVSRVVGREVTTSKEMTDADAEAVIDALAADAEAKDQPAEPKLDDTPEPPGWGNR